MAIRARLVAPPPQVQESWPFHELSHGSVPASLLFDGDRRMEAETYLSSGFAIRKAIEAHESGWVPLSKIASIWMPGRLKGIQVAPEIGTPFLAATQVLDVRPIPRKWLSLRRTEDAEARFVQSGMILVTCSGTVGRATLAHAPHENKLISHDLLRVEARDPAQRGWLYAYLLSEQVRAMATSAHYGHIIKHLEESHLGALPIPKISREFEVECNATVANILRLRNEGYSYTLEAEDRFEKWFGSVNVDDWGESGFSVSVLSGLQTGRRRMEACFHSPGIASIKSHLAQKALSFESIAEAGYEVWLPSRFPRIPAVNGVPLVGSSEIAEINPPTKKLIADVNAGDSYRGRIERGWLLLARSGQTYGIIGTVVIAERALQGKMISDHVIRIRPTRSARVPAGYLSTALSHPTLGRPLVKSLAYGSSIPEIEVVDISNFEFPRLTPSEELEISRFAVKAAESRSMADELERELAAKATKAVSQFMTHRRNG